MLAAVIHGAKDLRIENRAEPALQPGTVKVRFGAGGICGSDLSYYSKGGVGDFKIKQPMVLGHEVAGEIVEIGQNVSGLKVGQRVAINPNHPCGHCRTCVKGKRNLCLQMNFFGSAAVNPHIQGVFQEYLVVGAEQCHVVPNTMSFITAAMAEPLAVALHAVRRAGPLLGANVLITGMGPIGSLAALAARRAGAQKIVVTDVSDGALERAQKLGVDETVNAIKQTELVESWAQNKGTFDVAIEASGSPSAFNSAMMATASGGKLIQLGMFAGEIPVAMNRWMAREVDLMGAFRFGEEYAWAVKNLVEGTIDVTPLLTHQFHLSQANDAFPVAGDRAVSMKVHLTL